MRIDKFFSDLALFTRSEINKVLANNRVKVNGKIVKKSNFFLCYKNTVVRIPGPSCSENGIISLIHPFISIINITSC